MAKSKGIRLIDELKKEPESFYSAGKQYQLLQEFYKGLSKELLRELLHIEDIYIKRVAIWITSELGDPCVDLISDVLPLIMDSDYYVCCHALETIAVYSDNIDDCIRVFDFFEHENQIVRQYVMLIISSMRTPRLLEVIENLPVGPHKEGIMCLISIDEQDANSVNAMIDSHDPIIRKYGIMAAYKLYARIPSIMRNAVISQDSDVREFSQHMLSAKEKIARVFKTCD